MSSRIFLQAARAAAAICVTLCAGIASASPVWLVNGSGKLTGATGVIVNGLSYDVRFAAGSCSSLFSGCTDATKFAFHNAADGLAAAQALLDQVFVDGSAGNFDTVPSLINGCTTGPASCDVVIQYGLKATAQVYFAQANNFPANSSDLATANGSSMSITSGNNNSGTNAIFSLSVPEPGTAALVGLAAFGLLLSRQGRRPQRVAAPALAKA